MLPPFSSHVPLPRVSFTHTDHVSPHNRILTPRQDPARVLDLLLYHSLAFDAICNFLSLWLTIPSSTSNSASSPSP